MMKFLLSKHSRSIFIFALLSLFLCMAAGKASAKERNPVVKIDNTSYTSSGTEVTLRLWMFNYSNPFTNYSARFTGDVNLYIDDQVVIKLNSIWSSIAGAKRETIFTAFTDKPVDINIDGTNVGTAQFNNLQYGQTCPDNSNTTDNSWYTVDLKLSFNKSSSYYGHKITVKGKWQDQGSGSLVTKDVVLDNIINGFVRPINLKAQPSGGNMVFSWEQEGYNPSASTLGKWIVYKREGDNNVKLGEAAANEHSLSIEKKLYSCSNGYIMTFLPNVCKGEETVCGLTTSLAATGHKPNADDICQICGHSFFRYHTSDGNIVDISGRDFGANVVSHKVVDGECVIEFDAPITQIPQAAFFYKNLVGELRIPNTVTSIQIKAFYSCTGLTGNLVIPNSVKEIGGDAFNSCRGFNGTLTLSSNLKTIGGSAFYGCSGFTGSLTLPNSVTTIGNAAFRACGSFTNLELSNALSVIPYQAFGGCTSLSGNLVIPNSVKEIGICAFYECSGFNGSLTLSNNLKVIEERVFSGCSGFTGDLIIPNSVRTIGYGAFNQCSGFTGSLILPNSVTTIGESAFYNCQRFTGDLTLPNSVTTIGNTAFCNCSGFTGNLTIPNSVRTIGESAFYKCTGFTGKLTIPNSVTTIGKMAFYECSGFTGDLTIPNSVTTIETSTFEYCTGFKGKLTIPNSVTTIGEHAFNECSGFTGNLTIPNSVTTIGHLAFGACSGFTGDVSLPKSLEILGSTSFKACKKIKTIKFQSLPTVLKGSLNDYKAIVSLSDDSYISPEVSGTVNEISYTRQMSNNWGTLVLPYPLTLTGEESYRLYTISAVSEDELVLKQLDGEVAAGTPCVVKCNGSEAELTFSANNAELNMAINDQPMDGMNFSGTYWTKDVTNGYIIAKDCFWNVEKLKGVGSVTAVKVGPFRAWLDGTSANAPAQLSMRIDDSTTGINAAEALDALNDAEAEYYDLSGKRLDEPQKGVNIVRMKSGKTKKIIIK